jgi:hypothetical protein
MELSGRIASFPVGDILQWVHHERRTGSLVVRRSRREKRIFLRKGDIVGCLSDDPAEYYGQHLLLNGYLDEGSLVKALRYCKLQETRLGVALRNLGLLSPEMVQATLRSQIEDSVCDLFLWRSGVFYFQAGEPQDEEILPEPIHTYGLILEGTRWIDETSRMRRLLAHESLILRRGTVWPGEGLSPLQERVSGLVDGHATLQDLYRYVGGIYYRFLEAVFALAVNEVLDIESVGEASLPGSGSQEIHLYNLMLEQAAEDELHMSRQHLSVPISLIENFIPVWAHEPSAKDLDSMSTGQREFVKKIDGRSTLHELLSTDHTTMNLELDALLEQLRAARIALLPTSPADLDANANRRGEPAQKRWWRSLGRGKDK